MARRTTTGADKIILQGVSIVFIVVQFYFLYLRPISPLIHGIEFVCLLMLLTFLRIPAGKSAALTKIPWYDYGLGLLSLVPLVYALLDYGAFVERAGIPAPLDVLVGSLMTLLLLEAGRRSTGVFLPLMGVLFILYGISSVFLPEATFLPGLSVRRVVGTLYMTDLGIFGAPTEVAVRWIFIFVLFAQTLLMAGGEKFFIQLAQSIAGRWKGGPAYVSILSSALFGTLSGSNVANVLTTGQFTIPLMKRAGYSPLLAGAVEATASSGGALMPPIMGASAFIMAELTGLPYFKIAVAAVIPAILYYLGILVYMYGATQSLNVQRLDISVTTSKLALMKKYWSVILALVWFVYRIVIFYPLEYAALECAGMVLVAGIWTNRSQYRPQYFLESIGKAIGGIIDVGLPCAISGVLVGVILATGLGIEFAGFVTFLGKQSILAALFATMMVTLILGMSVPGIAAYIITAAVVVAPLEALGLPTLAIHMFVFYYSLFSGLTPPVCLTAFAAASLSGETRPRRGSRRWSLPCPATFSPTSLFTRRSS